MKLSSAELHELTDLAITAATAAGQMIAESRPQAVEHKAVGGVGGASLASAVVTEIDRRSEEVILEILRPTLERFDLGVLTEEQDDDQSRLTTDYFWSIDPLDGTLPFIEGVPGYAVSVALVQRDGTPRVGVIYDPVEQTLVHAISGAGAFRDGQPWLADSQTRGEALSVFADRSLLTRDDYDEVIDALEQVAHGMGLTDVRVEAIGGAVLNACRVLSRPPACYFKFPKPSGGGSLWDFAATACLFNELGAVATDIHGDPLDLNRADSTNMNHRGVLFATDETIARGLRALAMA